MDHKFRIGDRVRHARRPEWGEGRVRAAEMIRHDGHDAQRLMVDFAEKGRTTLNTALAPIIPTDMPYDRPADLAALPEAVNDPLTGPVTHLSALIQLYRFDRTNRGLIDWAIMQTGLADPLLEHERHELDDAFSKFLKRRDQRLHELIAQLRKAGKIDDIRRLFESCSQNIRQAVADTLKGGK